MNNSLKDQHMRILPASFRDPSGHMFEKDGILYRQINYIYRENYDHLIDSGLYKLLSERRLLVKHQEVNEPISDSELAYKIILPERIGFISYAYEWCFNQLKDAALLTLDLQLMALEHDMTLKDASVYNIQFHQGSPIMIDTLSFDKYIESQPWAAYRQFCQHFLAPLALMTKTDVRLNKLLIAYVDGIPLDLAARLLPRSTLILPGLAIHLHIHARTQRTYSETTSTKSSKLNKSRRISKMGMIGIIQSLRKAITNLKWRSGKTEWGDYYSCTNYSDVAFQAKKNFVEKSLLAIKPASVWDLGSNTGFFSRLASDLGIPTVSFDIDPTAVEKNYCRVREKNEKFLLPLLLDLTNPSPDLGWDSDERTSFCHRGPVECIMALALIHHLTISNNVPFYRVASFFSKLCTYLIVEFVPKHDSQVKRLLRSRVDIFETYDQANFEAVFLNYFQIIDSGMIQNSDRKLYLMQKLT